MMVGDSMKAIDWDKQDQGAKLAHSDKYNSHKNNALSRSATNYVKRSRRSNALPQVSEELEEDDYDPRGTKDMGDRPGGGTIVVNPSSDSSSIDKFMEQVEEESKHVPTMEELAQGSGTLLDQIEEVEKSGKVEGHSSANRSGAVMMNRANRSTTSIGNTPNKKQSSLSSLGRLSKQISR